MTALPLCPAKSYNSLTSQPRLLAYEAIYGLPVRELFAGLYQQAQQNVAARAKILNFRKARKPDVRKQQAIIHLAEPASVNSSNQ